MDALGGWWCPIIVFDILGLALCLGDFKRGLYLPGEPLGVIYPWDPTSSHHQSGVWTWHPSTQSTFCSLLLGPLVRDHSPCPLSVWWLAPAGSTQCLAPALTRAPDQDQWMAAQLLGLLQMLFWVQEGDPLG